MKPIFEKIILTPNDIELSLSPIRKVIKEPTFVLGAFNPALTRLPNGNLLIMVRIAESLMNSFEDNRYRIIRWEKNTGYVIDKIASNELDTSDPRKFIIKRFTNKTYCLTSSSWLLPVELNQDGDKIVQYHYDKCIHPEESYQEYGVEDARITEINGMYYMTVCSVASSRHSTALYSSNNGIDYKLNGMILDHQNKDMVLFPEKIHGKYYALTRPTGDHYFASSISSKTSTGPSIFLSESPDLLHWKPVEGFSIQPQNNSLMNMKVGGGAPPIKTDYGWLAIFHGVEQKGEVGIYRSFSCLLELDNPTNILVENFNIPVLECDPGLTSKIKSKKYLGDVVFTTGIDEDDSKYILASGELDLCCRITHIEKVDFNRKFLEK